MIETSQQEKQNAILTYEKSDFQINGNLSNTPTSSHHKKTWKILQIYDESSILPTQKIKVNCAQFSNHRMKTK